MASQAQVAQILALVESGIPLTEIPAGRPPPGQVSHLHHAVGRSYMITTCDIICIIIVCTVVAMRMYTRVRLLKSLWWDDCKSSAISLGFSTDQEHRVHTICPCLLVRRDRIVRMGCQGWSGQTHLRHPRLESLPWAVTWLGHLCDHVQHYHAVLKDVDPVTLPPCIPNQQLCKTVVGCRRLHCRLFHRSYLRVLVSMQAHGICLVSRSKIDDNFSLLMVIIQEP